MRGRDNSHPADRGAGWNTDAVIDEWLDWLLSLREELGEDATADRALVQDLLTVWAGLSRVRRAMIEDAAAADDVAWLESLAARHGPQWAESARPGRTLAGWTEDAERLHESYEQLEGWTDEARADLCSDLFDYLDHEELLRYAIGVFGSAADEPEPDKQLLRCLAWLSEHGVDFLPIAAYLETVRASIRSDLWNADPALALTLAKWDGLSDMLAFARVQREGESAAPLPASWVKEVREGAGSDAAVVLLPAARAWMKDKGFDDGIDIRFRPPLPSHMPVAAAAAGGVEPQGELLYFGLGDDERWAFLRWPAPEVASDEAHVVLHFTALPAEASLAVFCGVTAPLIHAGARAEVGTARYRLGDLRPRWDDTDQPTLVLQAGDGRVMAVGVVKRRVQ